MIDNTASAANLLYVHYSLFQSSFFDGRRATVSPATSAGGAALPYIPTNFSPAPAAISAPIVALARANGQGQDQHVCVCVASLAVQMRD